MKGIGATALLAAMLPLGLASTATADRLVEARTLFTGRNIYAPAVIDSAAPSPNPFAPLLNVFGRYAMWYGGWQSESDEPHDKIYRRVSQDNSVWSDPVTVVTPAQLPGSHVHVNDPSVTVTNRARPYTMFFTACSDPCGIAEGSEIWSAESSDGIAWTGFRRLRAHWSHPAEPSAVWAPSGRQVWKLYYTDRSECDKVRVVSVDAEREAFDVRTVYHATQPLTCALNPEVKRFNGTWHLFYNGSPVGGGFSIEEAGSSSNAGWSGYVPLIQNNGPRYCATVAPGVLPAGGADYDLYFGLTPRQPDGTCRVDDQRSIERWRFREG
jgi:hypothetical protein